jgi:hypothetical protein
MADSFPPWHGEDDAADGHILRADIPRSHQDTPPPKIYLRTLLFSTPKRGRVIESMHVALSRNETHQNFNNWVYGERGKLVRGSGLFVGETGVAADHHFLTPKDGSSFRFTEGHYRLEVFAHLLGDKKPLRPFSQALDVTREKAAAREERNAGLYFDWGPDSSRYVPHVENRSPSPDETHVGREPSPSEVDEFIDALVRSQQ